MSRVFQGVRPYSTRRFEVGDFAKHIRAMAGKGWSPRLRLRPGFSWQSHRRKRPTISRRPSKIRQPVDAFSNPKFRNLESSSSSCSSSMHWDSATAKRPMLCLIRQEKEKGSHGGHGGRGAGAGTDPLIVDLQMQLPKLS